MVTVDKVIVTLKKQLAIAKSVDGNFVTIPVGDAKKALEVLEESKLRSNTTIKVPIKETNKA